MDTVNDLQPVPKKPNIKAFIIFLLVLASTCF